MADPVTSKTSVPENPPENNESFGEILSQFQKSHSHRTEDRRQIEATVIAVTDESVFFDIGFKSEGILPISALQGEALKPGDKALVTVKGRDPNAPGIARRRQTEPGGIRSSRLPG